MSLKQKAGDHAKIAAATAERPKQIGILRFAGQYKASIRQYDIGFEKIVDSQSVQTAEKRGSVAMMPTKTAKAQNAKSL